jgi:uncharacterized alpha-E superfamily protein
MLSRVADAVYWASRYVERAENVARFVNVNLDLMLDSPSTQKPKWEPLVQTTGDQDWFYEHYPSATLDTVTNFLTFDRKYPHSILSSLIYARENARTVRDVISREMWQELNQLYLMVVEASKKPPRPEELSAFYERVKMSGIYYAGVTDATLSHGEVWHFARMGRMIERADKTSRILDVKYYILLPDTHQVGSAVDQVGWTALLNSASALQMYRQQVHHIDPREVAKFLLLDPSFPRSIRHSVHALGASLHAITGSKTASYSNEAERLVGKLRASLDFAEIDEIMDIGLHEYLDSLQGVLNDVGAALQKRFFERL